MNINAYNSNFISSLFSFGNSASAGSMSGLYSNLSEYNNIRNGNYYQLTKKYFSEFGTSDVSSAAKTSSTYDVLDQIRSKYTDKADTEDTQTKAEKDAKTNVNNAKALSTSVTNLMDNKTYRNGDDAVEGAVKDFVSAYNSVIDSGKDSSVSGIATNTKRLMDSTDRYASSLQQIGITADEETGKLSVDTDTLSKADASTVQDLFRRGGSYGMSVATNTSMISYYANAAATNGTYGSNGLYQTSSAYSFNGYV